MCKEQCNYCENTEDLIMLWGVIVCPECGCRLFEPLEGFKVIEENKQTS